MTEQVREPGAKLRNVFIVSEFQKRCTEGGNKDAVQVRTHNGKVLEKKEVFPCGFYAEAASGRTFVFCQGGNLDGFEILPVQPGDDAARSGLEEGDADIYAAEGGYTVYRNAGDAEVYAGGEGAVKVSAEKGNIEAAAGGSGKITPVCESGKMFFGNGSKNIRALLTGLIDEIKAAVTAGTPASRTLNPAAQQKFDRYKNQIKELFEESA